MRQFLEGCLSEVDDSFASHQAPGGSAVRDGNGDRSLLAVWRVDCYPHLRAQRIKPGGRGEFVRIKSVSVRHPFPALGFAVPGSHTVFGLSRAGTTVQSHEDESAGQEQGFHRNSATSWGLLSAVPDGE